MSTQAGGRDPQDTVDLEFDESPEPGGPALGLVAALAAVVVGAIAAALSLALGLGTLADPGPGLWPLIVAAAMVIMGVALLPAARRDTSTEAFTRGLVGASIGALSLVLFALSIEAVGFEIPTVLLVVLWLRGIGAEGWRTAVVTGVVAAAVLHLLFIELLGVNLPHLI